MKNVSLLKKTVLPFISVVDINGQTPKDHSLLSCAGRLC